MLLDFLLDIFYLAINDSLFFAKDPIKGQYPYLGSLILDTVPIYSIMHTLLQNASLFWFKVLSLF